MKEFIKSGHPESQPWLLPPSIDEFVGPTASVRVVNKLLSGFDWSKLLDQYAGVGRPAYDPVSLTKVLIFGSMIGIRSSRRLEEALQYDLRFMFLAHMATPDFRTIARFRRNHEAEIAHVFMETVISARKAGLIDLRHVSVDGTKIEANASRRSYRDLQELDKAIERTEVQIKSVMAEWELQDRAEEARPTDDESPQLPKKAVALQSKKQRLEDAKKVLEERKSKGVIVTDQDSRLIRTGSGIRPAYNGQAVVDSKNQVIIATVVVQDEADNAQFKPMMKMACENMGATPECVTADGGYWSPASLEYVEDTGLNAYIAPTGRKENIFKEYVYDPVSDTYTKPDGQCYVYHRTRHKERRKYRVYMNKPDTKELWVPEDAERLSAMRDKMNSVVGKQAYRARKTIIEPVFGHLKGSINLRRMLLRGLRGANIEYLIACIAHNVGKLVLNAS